MGDWQEKEGYDTYILANGNDLSAPAVEVQLFRFRKGKFGHHHRQKTEFFYFTLGNGRVIIDGQERALSPGSTLLVRPNVRHTFVNDSDSELLEGIMVKTNNDPTDTFRD
jgi:quercetin dioxygenase-like cupin family protein